MTDDGPFFPSTPAYGGTARAPLHIIASLEMIQARHSKALGWSYTDCYVKLLKIASTLASPSESEDLVHDAFLRILQQPRRANSTAEHDVHLRKLLFKAIGASVRNSRRARSRALARNTRWWREVSRIAREWMDPSLRVDEDEIVRIVRRGVEALPKGQREVFLLMQRCELSYVDVAHVLGVRPNSVCAQFLRATKTLRAALGAAGYHLTEEDASCARETR